MRLTEGISTHNASLKKSQRFEKQPVVIYPMNKLSIKFYRIGIEEISKQGHLKYLTLFLKLKKEYTSSHFHSYKKKPTWYPGKEQTFRNHINWMIEKGWVKVSNDEIGFRLISQEELYKMEVPTKYQKDYFFTGRSKIITLYNADFQGLYKELQKSVVIMNYKKQIHNIAALNAARDNNLEKDKRSYERHLKLYKKAIYSNVSSVADCNSKNTTSLSCKGMARLFGRKADYGYKLYNRMIDSEFITRKKDYKLVPSVHADDLKTYNKNMPYKQFYSIGHRVYKCKTTFMINEFRNLDTEVSILEKKLQFKNSPIFKSPILNKITKLKKEILKLAEKKISAFNSYNALRPHTCFTKELQNYVDNFEYIPPHYVVGMYWEREQWDMMKPENKAKALELDRLKKEARDANQKRIHDEIYAQHPQVNYSGPVIKKQVSLKVLQKMVPVQRLHQCNLT